MWLAQTWHIHVDCVDEWMYRQTDRWMRSWKDWWKLSQGSAEKRDWNEKRRDAPGQGLMKFNPGREGFGLKGLWKSCHPHSKNLTPWFHRKRLSLFYLAAGPGFHCIRNPSSSLWWLPSLGLCEERKVVLFMMLVEVVEPRTSSKCTLVFKEK